MSFEKQKTITSQALNKEPEFYREAKKYLAKANTLPDPKDSFDSIIYGISCSIILSEKLNKCVLFQGAPDYSILTVANLYTETSMMIDLNNVTHFSFTPHKEIEPMIRGVQSYMNVMINKLSYDFIFEDNDSLLEFLTALIVLYDEYIKIDETLIENKIAKIWRKYDTDYSKKLDKQEFALFCNDLKLNMGDNTLTHKIFNIIDQDKSGEIEYDEFLQYYRKFTSGAEYSELFQGYSSDGKILSVLDFQNFYINHQKEKITLPESAEIMINYKQNISLEEKQRLIEKFRNNFYEITEEEISKIVMELDEFKQFVQSPMTSVYNYDLMNEEQDMTRPLNDYFINSTHNTYITGHQLSGSSDPKMYSFAVLEGYRLVELDCYAGDKDIIITHGYTMVSDIFLSQILSEMRKYAFINTPYPVLLSIENHMDAKGQALFMKECKEILKDLYIIPHDDLPQDFPSPRDLEGKFILKMGGKRLYRKVNTDRSTPPIKDKDSSSPVNRPRGKSMISLITSDSKPNETPSIIDKGMSKTSAIKGSNKNAKNIKNIDKAKLKELKKNSEVIPEMDQSRGMFGTKFDMGKIQESNFQPWEMVTLKCSKVIKYATAFDTRKKIINYNKNSFCKAYPTNFDSSNYDVVKCWIAGVQVAALNFQSLDDDDLLLNKMFFKINRNCGYVMKPKKLLPESTFYEVYDLAYGQVAFNIKSLIGINHLLQKAGLTSIAPNNITLKCNIVGSDSDDKFNTKYQINFIGNYISLKPKPPLQNIQYMIYEKDLSAFWFRLEVNEVVIGRAVIPIMLLNEGLRTIRFYDNQLEEIVESFLVMEVSKKINDVPEKY